jgi:hypothetical protein
MMAGDSYEGTASWLSDPEYCGSISSSDSSCCQTDGPSWSSSSQSEPDSIREEDRQHSTEFFRRMTDSARRLASRRPRGCGPRFPQSSLQPAYARRIMPANPRDLREAAVFRKPPPVP